MTKLITLGLLPLGALGLAVFNSPSTTAAPAPVPGTETIFDTAVSNGNFTTLVAALQATGLDAPLTNESRFTVFAPTDAAFAALPPGTVAALLNDLPTLEKILLYHVVPGALLAPDVLSAETLTTLVDQRVDISLQNGMPFVDNALIEMTDILCDNGIIHVIDAVLLPNTETVLATVAADVDLSTLASVATFPSIVNRLDNPDKEFTLFAPNDAAFAAIPPDRLLEILSRPSLVRDILQVHVVPGRLYASDVLAAGQVTTITGKVLPVTVVNGSAFIDGVEIVETDIEAVNGTIHKIGGVLLP